MPRPAYLILDTLDDRREIHRLLGLLSPVERIAFIGWCCRQVPGKLRPQPSRRMEPRLAMARKSDPHDERLTMELYMDFWMLANNHSLDVETAAKELERRARKLPT